MANSTDIQVTLPDTLAEQLKQEIQATGETDSEVVAQALKEYLYAQAQQRAFIAEDDCND